MNRFFFLVCLLFIMSGCRKNIDSSATNFGTYVPPSKPITTTILGFILDENNHPISGSNYFKVGTASFPLSTGLFNTGQTTVDQFTPDFALSLLGNYHSDLTTLPLTDATVNYVKFKGTYVGSKGTFINAAGGTIAFDSSCSITFPANSLYNPGNGYYQDTYDPAMTVNIGAAYLNPTVEDFGFKLPSYGMADEAGKRYFLQSYGAATFVGYSETTGRSISFHNSSATLKIPIPAAMLSSAPTSIPVWHLVSGRWTKYGTATRKNSSYEAPVANLGFYNFAEAMDGLYRTIHVQTDSGSAVVAGSVRLKTNNAVAAESVTNPNGDAIMFLPLNKDLSITVSNGWGSRFSPDVIYNTSYPASNTNGDITVTIQTTAKGVYSFKGEARDCNGNPIKTGFAEVSIPFYSAASYYIPINNGRYQGAVLGGVGFNGIGSFIKVNDGAVVGADTSITAKEGQQNSANLSTCITATNLFMNYSVDGVSFSITGDLSSAVPRLEAQPDFSMFETLISTSETSSKNLQFGTNASTTGVYTGSGIEDLWVNGIPCYYDPSVMKVIFSRFDWNYGGIIAGTADFYYREYPSPSVLHHLMASFRLKRT